MLLKKTGRCIGDDKCRGASRPQSPNVLDDVWSNGEFK